MKKAEDSLFGTNELIFTETKIFETKVVPRGMLYTIVYYRFKKNNKNINSTNNTKNETEKNRKPKLWSQKKHSRRRELTDFSHFY